MTVPRALCVIAALCVAAANGGVMDDLTPSQVQEIDRGRQVVLMEEVDGHPWPRLRIYQRVNASPEEVAAVFFDYANAKSYIPKLLKSEVVKTVSPCVLEVEYGVDVPFLADEFYAARNSLSSDRGDYRVDWILLRALQTKASEGNLRIERTGTGSVICYTNLVTPGSKMAVVLRIPAIQQMKSTVQAIVDQVEKQKAKNPAELERQISALRAALAADPERVRK